MDQSSTPATSTTNLTPAKPMPFWQTVPCPAWCTEAHRDTDSPDDRYHLGDSVDTSLSLEPAEPLGSLAGTSRETWRAPRLRPALLQHVREAEPVVELHDERDTYTVKLTLDEGEAFARGILAMVAEARTAGGAA